jgi:hypothetical protein
MVSGRHPAMRSGDDGAFDVTPLALALHECHTHQKPDPDCLDGDPQTSFFVCANGGRKMAYVVRAIHRDGVTLAFTIEKQTLREAKESAKALRDQGLWVLIYGPDGKTVDETKE